jgi:hypothetical protein
MSYDDEIQRLTEIERITDDKSSYFDMDEAGVSLHGSNPATHVRFGSKADINRTIANAALPPKADISQHNGEVRPLAFPAAVITTD